MTITKLIYKAHDNAKAKGFYDKPIEVGTMIALIHSELSEALEAHRTGKLMDYEQWNELKQYQLKNTLSLSESVRDTFEVEIADAVIRIFDLCGYLEISLESVIEAKMRYNRTRPKLHGKLY